MDSFSTEYGYGGYYEYGGLCSDFMEVGAKEAVAFEVDIKHGGRVPPPRFRNAGLPTLMRSAAHHKIHHEKAGPAPMAAHAQAKAKQHNELVASRAQMHAEALKESPESVCAMVEHTSHRSETAPTVLASQSKAMQHNRLVTSRVQKHEVAMKESIVRLRTKLEAQVSSKMVSEAKARAQRHNELVAEKKRARTDSVAQLAEEASTSAFGTPPPTQSAPLFKTPEKVKGPILLKSGCKLISVSAQCKYYGSARGCRFGEKCMYKHSDPRFAAPCKHMMAGSCKFGSDCFFRHTDLNVPQTKPLR